MSRAASGISRSRVISVPLIRTVADRTVRSVRTSLYESQARWASASESQPDPGFIGPAEVGQQEFQGLVRSMPP